MSSHKPLQDAWAEIWVEIKEATDVVLRANSLNIGIYAESFHQVIELTADPRVALRFDALNDRLWINIWNALFHPPFELAGAFLEEKDHQDFQREKGVLGISYSQYQEFRKKYGRELEIRGHTKQLEFLQAVRESIDGRWEIQLNGTAIRYDLDKRIKGEEKHLEALSSMTSDANEYQESSTVASSRDIMGIMKRLNINLSGIGETTKHAPILWEISF
jgi:hypothetical protein